MDNNTTNNSIFVVLYNCCTISIRILLPHSSASTGHHRGLTLGFPSSWNNQYHRRWASRRRASSPCWHYHSIVLASSQHSVGILRFCPLATMIIRAGGFLPPQPAQLAAALSLPARLPSLLKSALPSALAGTAHQSASPSPLWRRFSSIPTSALTLPRSGAVTDGYRRVGAPPGSLPRRSPRRSSDKRRCFSTGSSTGSR